MTPKDWRGSAGRFTEGQYLLDSSAGKAYALARPCEVVLVTGLAVCTRLSSVRSLWQQFIVTDARPAASDGAIHRTAEVTLIATCRECRGHYGRSKSSYSVLARQSLWRSTELLMSGGISISLQISG